MKQMLWRSKGVTNNYNVKFGLPLTPFIVKLSIRFYLKANRWFAESMLGRRYIISPICPEIMTYYLFHITWIWITVYKREYVFDWSVLWLYQLFFISLYKMSILLVYGNAFLGLLAICLQVSAVFIVSLSKFWLFPLDLNAIDIGVSRF